MHDRYIYIGSDRIVSFHQLWICLILHGKEKGPIEFSVKFYLRMDSHFCFEEMISCYPNNIL